MITPKFQGDAVPLETVKGAEFTAGQVAQYTGEDNEVEVADKGGTPAGLFATDSGDVEVAGMCAIWMNQGVYETDQYEGTPVSGDKLAETENGKLAVISGGYYPSSTAIAVAIACSGGILKFQLRI